MSGEFLFLIWFQNFIQFLFFSAQAQATEDRHRLIIEQKLVSWIMIFLSLCLSFVMILLLTRVSDWWMTLYTSADTFHTFKVRFVLWQITYIPFLLQADWQMLPMFLDDTFKEVPNNKGELNLHLLFMFAFMMINFNPYCLRVVIFGHSLMPTWLTDIFFLFKNYFHSSKTHFHFFFFQGFNLQLSDLAQPTEVICP